MRMKANARLEALFWVIVRLSCMGKGAAAVHGAAEASRPLAPKSDLRGVRSVAGGGDSDASEKRGRAGAFFFRGAAVRPPTPNKHGGTSAWGGAAPPQNPL